MAKKPAADDVPYNANLRENWDIACKTLKVAPQPACITSALSPEADPEGPIAMLSVKEAVGEGPIVAICAAILGRGGKMKPTMYKHLKGVTLLNAGCGDAGGAAVAELVRHGKAAMPMETVSMTDCGLGLLTSRAFGEALMLGANITLTALSLDLNPGIGDEGVGLLARGLHTNRILKALSLAYCDLGVPAAKALTTIITAPLPTLEVINLAGNTRLGSKGVLILTQAAKKSMLLKELGFRDCGIGSVHPPSDGELADVQGAAEEVGAAASSAASVSSAAGGEGGGDGGEMSAEDTAAMVDSPGLSLTLGTGLPLTTSDLTRAALRSLGQALSLPTCGLCRSTLEMNPITSEEAALLLEYLGPQAGNAKCEAFRVDLTIRPPSLFAGLLRVPVVKKGKKGKK